MNGRKINIIIVDSGVDISHKSFRGLQIKGYSFINGILSDGFSDTYGHGTAVYGIISCVNDFADIVNIKIPNVENFAREEDLIQVLQYIRTNMRCDILNLSMGLNVCIQFSLLKQVCDDIAASGTIIISAFDNNGSISYPAAYENVLGVVSASQCKKVNDFLFYDDDVLNIAAKGSIQRVAWTNSQYLMMAGNSFACAHVTVQVARFMREGYLTMEEIKKKFCQISIYQCKLKDYNYNKSVGMTINRAAIFPFNKEMHSLVRYEYLLNFEVEDIYDTKYSAKVGTFTQFLMDDVSVRNHIIKNVNDIDWESIDTLIIGHTDSLSYLINDVELKRTLINDAITRNRKIVSFDDLSKLGYQNNEKIYYPKVDYENLPPFRHGMLYVISKPVVGVFGTSSKQGKFTLQLKLREILLNRGYDVGQIGTEPSSLLFGMDYCYPMGYNSSVYIRENAQIIYLNYILNALCEKNKDIILVGSQSGTIPYDMGNIKMLNTAQFLFLMGTQPDCVVLTVNPYDDVSYIKRTKAFIESSVRTKVISLVIFPMDLNKDWSGVYGKKKKMDKESLESLKYYLVNTFCLPVFTLGHDEDMENLADLLVDFFSDC